MLLLLLTRKLILLRSDTVIHEGVIKTVSRTDIHVNTFMGTTIFGDSYNLGYKKVTLVEHDLIA